MATFEIFEGDITVRKLWFWHLVGANGEVMCASEGYTTKEHAERAVERFKQVVPNAETAILENE